MLLLLSDKYQDINDSGDISSIAKKINKKNIPRLIKSKIMKIKHKM